MTPKRTENPTARQAEHVLKDVYLPRILLCLDELSQSQIWWRPNEASNSIGNLVLHLEGNLRQWIVSGLGGRPDRRQRDLEFSTRRPIPRRALSSRLENTVKEACGIVRNLTAADLERVRAIQKFKVTGLEAVFHVTEHFSHHAGQIILLTKMQAAKDLGFTRLPRKIEEKKGRELPAW